MSSRDHFFNLYHTDASTFEAIGDLVIFMRKRTLSGDPEFYGLGLNATMDG